jgi:ArsR family transcriptional regulator
VVVRDVAQFFKVLADEARLEMLWLLFNHRELCVCDIMAALEITQSKASRHLRTLLHAGLVTDRKDGLWCHYSIVSPDGELQRAQLRFLRTKLGEHPDADALLRKLAVSLDRKCCKGAPAAARRAPRPGGPR